MTSAEALTAPGVVGQDFLPLRLPGSFGEEAARQRRAFEAVAAAAHPYPAERFSGRGIVVCGGGRKYFPGVWVCVKILRHLGCTLPVQVWHLGAAEMTPAMRALLAPLGVECVDAFEVRQRLPIRNLHGWELKSYALTHCRFAEVLLLDADNVPLRDPAFLFDTPEYRQTGALFWPDLGRLDRHRAIWEICGMDYPDEPEFESGQIVLDKARTWAALQLALHLNAHSDFYYRHLHGDKETFHLAWHKLAQPCAMPRRPVTQLRHTMVQHDFAGQRLFQHRNMDKWRLDRENDRVPGFALEDECRGFLRELAALWQKPAPGVRSWTPEGRDPARRDLARELCAQPYMYHRVGADFRPMTFRPNGRVGQGAAACETFWDLQKKDDAIELILSGPTARTCALRRAADGSWRGAWSVFEKMPVELTPHLPVVGRAPLATGSPSLFAEKMPRLLHQIWLGPRPFPEEARRFAEGWRARHPHWHYQLWTEREIAGLDLELAPLMAEAENVAMRADLLRYELLHRYGGLYLDTDFESLRPLDDLLPQVNAAAFAGFEPSTVSYRFSLCNALLGALPGAPFFTHLLARLPESIARHRAEREWHREEYIPRATGPAFLTRCAAECPEITAFPQPVLYPRPEQVATAHARHHYRGTWKGRAGQGATSPAGQS